MAYDFSLPTVNAPTPLTGMAAKIARTNAGIIQAGRTQLAQYKSLRAIWSNELYAALEADKPGSGDSAGKSARLAKTSMLAVGDPTTPDMIALAADPVPVFKILDPLNMPAGLSDAAKAAFAEIAAAL